MQEGVETLPLERAEQVERLERLKQIEQRVANQLHTAQGKTLVES